jgi:hypothetical protein
MNERIKELLVKAGIDFGNFESVTIDIDNAKKFAELLVKDCASIAGKAEYSDTWLEPVEDAIKKHFGIEE